MAEHMQAVKTIWNLEYKSFSGVPHRLLVENPNEIHDMLRFIKGKSDTVKMTETRTCDAMPGLVFTKENIIDIDLLFND